MSFQPANSLYSRTYLGLIVAQFLAAFNDQCIHASAMFYAIHKGFLTKANAISLMPILFFAPWAIFCTLAGYLADRFSKRQSLVFWKIAEIGITVIALSGFFAGSVWHMDRLGPALVLSTVFLMGTHSAFFVPAKYGCLPEILQPSQLSKANGVLESTSFLAVILGTVVGGMLSSKAFFKGQEQFIGCLLVGLALVGAAASMLIEKMPAANPTRPFPRNLLKPLLDNLRTMARSRPLVLSILGIAFFTFMVAFMRASMYMHGETRNPPWSESHTSLVVGVVMLGVGLGSPLAGFLSGGKVELGLVPLGTLGMIAALLLAAVTIFWDFGLVAMLIVIGFCSGFYIIPLYTLLQLRAPKTSKGDLIATSNFINVTGAIAASVLFFLLVYAAQLAGLVPLVPQDDNYARGTLTAAPTFEHGRPVEVKVLPDDGIPIRFEERTRKPELPDGDDEQIEAQIDIDEGFLELVSGRLDKGSDVVVSRYLLRGVEHYRVRAAGDALKPVYDEERLPRFLFLGAAGMTLGILILLCRQLPDFFVRSLLWLRSWGRYRLRVEGGQNMPTSGPVILATNCTRIESCMQVLSVTDRFTRFVLLDNHAEERPGAMLRLMARTTSLAILQPGRTPLADWQRALEQAVRVLDEEEVVGLPAAANGAVGEVDDFLRLLEKRHQAVIVPVYCVQREMSNGEMLRVKVIIGKPLPPETPADLVRREIEQLAHGAEGDGSGSSIISTIPAASSASPTPPATDRPARP